MGEEGEREGLRGKEGGGGGVEGCIVNSPFLKFLQF